MIRKIAPHLCLAISVMMLVFLVVNLFNESMGFLKGDVFETLLLIYVAVSVITSAFLIAANEKRK
ncbi:MAG: hypothetical protein PHO15_00885 [Eubacteriales bacterium]|nr:hypothetical protein [Eubacteriales bacterium]